MSPRFCGQCGGPLVPAQIGDDEDVPRCPTCDRSYCKHPASCVLVAVINERTCEVILLRQNYVSESHWVLVAASGRVNAWKTQRRGRCSRRRDCA